MLTAGFVLVGGKSSRMGRDKALLPWKSGLLVQEVAATVAAVCGTAVLVGDPDRYAHIGYPCIPDFRPGLGPLSGIEAALASGRGRLNLILACDMPEIEDADLSSLVHAATESNAKCVVAADALGKVHPLCGVYRSECLSYVKNALDERRLRLMSLIEELQAEVLAFDTRICNVNTENDWTLLRNG